MRAPGHRLRLAINCFAVRGVRPGSVSYTHLDVYKRQELLDCNGCTACTMGMSMGKNTGCSLADKDDKQKIMDVMLSLIHI